MGARGPAPKRSDQRRRRNKPDIPLVKGVSGGKKPTEADALWHPSAIALFDSLADSGQSQYYESSDWQLAHLLCEQLSRRLKTEGAIKGSDLSALMNMANNLLLSEGARRRVSVELSRNESEQMGKPALVANFADAKKRLSTTGS